MGEAKAAAQVRRDKREKQLELFRRVGFGALAAIVLLPPYLLGLLVLGSGCVYICIVLARSMGMRNW